MRSVNGRVLAGVLLTAATAAVAAWSARRRYVVVTVEGMTMTPTLNAL